MSAQGAFQVGVDQQWIQVAQYDSNSAHGNVNVFVSAFEGYSNTVTLSFTILPFNQNTQPWGVASGAYTPASVKFSTTDGATGQTLSSTAVVSSDGQTVTLTPPDVVQIHIVPSTDPSQAAPGQNSWQMLITGTDSNGLKSTAAVTIVVQLGCPYLYGISFQSASITTVNTGSDPALLNDSNQGRIFFVNGLFWLFSVTSYTINGVTHKDIQYFTSTDGFDWNLHPVSIFGTNNMGFNVPNTTFDNFWDCEYDPSISAFVIVAAQGSGNTTEVDFVIAHPDNAGTLIINQINADIPSFTVKNADPAAGVGVPSIITNGTKNVWVTVSYEDLDSLGHVDVWYYNGSWSVKRTDTFGRGVFYKGIPFFFSSYGNVVVIEGALAGSKLSAYSTSDGGNTWTSMGTTANSYYISYGNGQALPFGAPGGPAVNLVVPDITNKVRFVSLTSQFSNESVIGSGFNTSSLTMQNSSNLYALMANTNTVAIAGSSNGGATWTAPQVLSNSETGIRFGSLHSTSSTFNDAANHLSLDAVWTNLAGSLASIRNTVVDLSSWPSILNATSVNSIIIPRGESRSITGFVYPIGVNTVPASNLPATLSIGFPPGADYYGVTASFSNGKTTMSIPAPVSVDNTAPFTAVIKAPPGPPANVSLPFTTILTFQASDGTNNANPSCVSNSILVVTVV